MRRSIHINLYVLNNINKILYKPSYNSVNQIREIICLFYMQTACDEPCRSNLPTARCNTRAINGDMVCVCPADQLLTNSGTCLRQFSFSQVFSPPMVALLFSDFKIIREKKCFHGKKLILRF